MSLFQLEWRKNFEWNSNCLSVSQRVEHSSWKMFLNRIIEFIILNYGNPFIVVGRSPFALPSLTTHKLSTPPNWNYSAAFWKKNYLFIYWFVLLNLNLNWQRIKLIFFLWKFFTVSISIILQLKVKRIELLGLWVTSVHVHRSQTGCESQWHCNVFVVIMIIIALLHVLDTYVIPHIYTRDTIIIHIEMTRPNKEAYSTVRNCIVKMKFMIINIFPRHFLI